MVQCGSERVRVEILYSISELKLPVLYVTKKLECYFPFISWMSQEHYLPHVMHSRVKLACSGKGDPSLSSFLDKSLSDSKKRALLESGYPTELALYSIVKDDLDRARYYTGICLQSFLHVCMHPAFKVINLCN